MAKDNKVYDMNRVNTLLRYEKIPAYIMTDEQKAYLAGYRAQLEERATIVIDTDDKIRVRRPLVEATSSNSTHDIEIDAAVADLVETTVAKTAKKTRKKSSKKTTKSAETPEKE